MHTAYVLLLDGYADWEPASALAELRRTFGFAVKAMGLDAAAVTLTAGASGAVSHPLERGNGVAQRPRGGPAIAGHDGGKRAGVVLGLGCSVRRQVGSESYESDRCNL